MVLKHDNIAAASDVFPLLYDDVRQRHVVLSGSDPFVDLKIKDTHRRLRIEQELREARIRMRRAVVDALGSEADIAGAVARKVKQIRGPLARPPAPQGHGLRTTAWKRCSRPPARPTASIPRRSCAWPPLPRRPTQRSGPFSTRPSRTWIAWSSRPADDHHPARRLLSLQHGVRPAVPALLRGLRVRRPERPPAPAQPPRAVGWTVAWGRARRAEAWPSAASLAPTTAWPWPTFAKAHEVSPTPSSRKPWPRAGSGPRARPRASSRCRRTSDHSSPRPPRSTRTSSSRPSPGRPRRRRFSTTPRRRRPLSRSDSRTSSARPPSSALRRSSGSFGSSSGWAAASSCSWASSASCGRSS